MVKYPEFIFRDNFYFYEFENEEDKLKVFMEVEEEDGDLKNLNILKEQADENINKEELGDEFESTLP
jgi:hypothetical protein